MGEIALERPLQPARGKPAPLVPADSLPAGRGAGGSGAYVHKHIATSSRRAPQVFQGTTLDGEQMQRDQARSSVLGRVAWSLYRASKTNPDLEDHACRLLSCGSWYRKLDFYGCSQNGVYRLVPCPCNSVFCQRCAARRSKPLIARILKKIDRKKRYWFLTITVSSWEHLTREKISGLIGQFSELRESDVWKKHVTGGIYSIEATFNGERRNWHPHLHVLIESEGRLPRSWIYRLRVLWRRLTGSHVLNLQPLYGRNKKGRKTRRINRRALRELVKYATKAADFARKPDRVVEFLQAFTNVRRVQTFGSFFAKSDPDPNTAEEHAPEDLVGCPCGKCRWKDGVPGALFRDTETILRADGVRQLKLFGNDPFWNPEKPPDPEPQPEVSAQTKNLDLFFHQTEIAFA